MSRPYVVDSCDDTPGEKARETNEADRPVSASFVEFKEIDLATCGRGERDRIQLAIGQRPDLVHPRDGGFLSGKQSVGRIRCHVDLWVGDGALKRGGQKTRSAVRRPWQSLLKCHR